MMRPQTAQKIKMTAIGMLLLKLVKIVSLPPVFLPQTPYLIYFKARLFMYIFYILLSFVFSEVFILNKKILYLSIIYLSIYRSIILLIIFLKL
jgi:hypothetical protein